MWLGKDASLVADYVHWQWCIYEKKKLGGRAFVVKIELEKHIRKVISVPKTLGNSLLIQIQVLRFNCIQIFGPQLVDGAIIISFPLFNIALEGVLQKAGCNSRGTVFYRSSQFICFSNDMDIVGRKF